MDNICTQKETLSDHKMEMLELRKITQNLASLISEQQKQVANIDTKTEVVWAYKDRTAKHLEDLEKSVERSIKDINELTQNLKDFSIDVKHELSHFTTVLIGDKFTEGKGYVTRMSDMEDAIKELKEAKIRNQVIYVILAGIIGAVLSKIITSLV